MVSPASLSARQAISIASALIMLALPLAVSAQDASPAPSLRPSAATAVGTLDPSIAPATSPAPEPTQLQQALHPRAGLGMNLADIIEGGPGYIAVGGGSPDGLDLRALVWISDDGILWEAVPLKGLAAEGAMEGVAALPGGGYVAVGRDFKPPTERAELARALVWYSQDGTKWKRVRMDKSVRGSVMWDVTATLDGVAVAGCLAGYHCDSGRVWTSADGQTWNLIDDIAMAPYAIAADTEGNLVIGGENDAYDLVGAQATVAASAEDWTARLLANAESSVTGVTAYDDGFLAAGTLWDRNDQSLLGSALQRSTDGLDWELLQPEQLGQTATHDISAGGGLVALVGMEPTKKDRLLPVVRWSRDLEVLEPIALPEDAKPNQTDLSGVRVTDDGARVFVFGSERGRPIIWLSEVE